MTCLVGVDIGGTFTDAVLLDDAGTACDAEVDHRPQRARPRWHDADERKCQ
ncbi:hypothetical protein ACNTMW_29830 [Planosporangium sp. 12N6]|uniref:hypothetical protein n=1 Tax=Planosporangium spinosum TaxID=3402278 RepID=UPI003CF20827